MSEWVDKMSELQKDCIRVAQLTQAKIQDEYFDNYRNEDITEFPLNSYVLVHYGDTRPSKLSLDWKGPYRVVARDDEDFDRYTVQNLVTKS